MLAHRIRAPPVDPGSIPSTCIEAHTGCNFSSRGFVALCWPLLYTWHVNSAQTYIHTDKTLTQKNV